MSRFDGARPLDNRDEKPSAALPLLFGTEQPPTFGRGVSRVNTPDASDPT